LSEEQGLLQHLMGYLLLAVAVVAILMVVLEIMVVA
jgi:hypothetical protein